MAFVTPTRLKSGLHTSPPYTRQSSEREELLAAPPDEGSSPDDVPLESEETIAHYEAIFGELVENDDERVGMTAGHNANENSVAVNPRVRAPFPSSNDLSFPPESALTSRFGFIATPPAQDATALSDEAADREATPIAALFLCCHTKPASSSPMSPGERRLPARAGRSWRLPRSRPRVMLLLGFDMNCCSASFHNLTFDEIDSAHSLLLNNGLSKFEDPFPLWSVSSRITAQKTR